ncbi:MAG: hypothetical protein ABIQ33_04840 [Caldimonas sp.]
MLRYYMTPETRDAVIAESNRLIAARAATKASGKQGENPQTDFGAASQWSGWGSMTYVTRVPASPPKYQGLMRFVAMTNR